MKSDIKNVNDLLQGEVTSKEIINNVFNPLERQLLDQGEIILDFQRVTFISVYFLERLEQFVLRAKDLSVKVKLVNVNPTVYKVFQVGRLKNILELCMDLKKI